MSSSGSLAFKGDKGDAGVKGDPGGWIGGTDLAGTDLNTITTPGIYRKTSTGTGLLALHYPNDTDSGVLTVLERAGGATVIQEWHSFSPSSGGPGRGYFYRAENGAGTWLPWAYIPAQRVDLTAGRAIYTWDHLNGREQLVYGDTGWRDVTSLVNATNFDTANASRLLYIRRQGYEVTLSGQLSIIAAAPFSYSTFCAIPAGFRFDAGLTSMTGTEGTALMVRGSTAPLRALTIGTDVALQTISGVGGLGNMASGDVVNLCMKWSTSTAWPTTLPGSAAGSIPYL